MTLALISIVPFITAMIVPTIRERLPRLLLTWLVTALCGILFFYLLSYLPLISEGSVTQASLPWVPQLGLTLSLYLDGLALLFALIIVGVGGVVSLYAGYYFEDTDELNRFYTLLFAFMGAMLAVVLAGNVLTLFIAWEATSIVSFLLIGFYGAVIPEARSGALRSLMVTGGGGLALLVGFMLMSAAAGSTEMHVILSSTTLHEHPWYAAFTVLILAGCFTKSAQFPFHFWLPGAMAAPTPASAYLHSATMVKAGVYLLFRLYPVLGDTPLWQGALTTIGLATLLVGAVLALRQNDLKLALANSTISQLGAFVALIGLPGGIGLEAALVGVLAHSLYKATLFLAVGTIDHCGCSRDLRRLGGLAGLMPGWAVVVGLAVLSMAGVPPLLGFVAKEALLAAVSSSPLIIVVVVLSASLTVAMALILFVDVFLGSRRELSIIHEPAPPMLIGPGVLAGGALIAGIQLDLFVKPLLQPALHEELHLSLFSGVNLPLVLSLVALTIGGAIFATRERWRVWAFPALPDATAVYDQIVLRIGRVGDLLLRSQDGNLRHYLVVILGAVLLLQIPAGLTHVANIEWAWNGETDLLRGLLLVLALGAMLASIVIRHHLTAALLLGVGGYSVGGLFLLEPAPDVALVQFMVETLGTVLLIVMLRKISVEQRQAAMDNLWKGSRAGLLRDITISTLIGAGVGLFALAAVGNRPALPAITLWHLENAMPMLGFPDVVGAIVTDFRGMDTIIEISVFSVAALGVLTLLAKPAPDVEWQKRLVRPTQQHAADTRIVAVREVTPEDEERDDDVFDSRFSTPLTRTMAQLVLPISLLVALAQLFYGGEGPGDGFTAGVVSGLGVALWYIVFGYHESQARLGWLKPRYLIGVGLTLVIANALLPMLVGLPFLRHISFDQIHLPANLHLSTTFIYETGIFLTVLGSTSTVMEAITYPKEIEPL